VTITHPYGNMRLNDGRVGPDGAFWVGSMDERVPSEPLGSLYHVGSDVRCEDNT
jgi:sugar lactone lactonase YvrE